MKRKHEGRLGGATALAQAAIAAGLLGSTGLAGDAHAQSHAAPTAARPASGASWLAEWTGARRAAAAAPNVIVVLTDDVGFAAASPFGGPIPTPTLQALADRGLRYNRFHVTAICGPTRAALLTGRNHHAVSMGFLPEIPDSEPGYTSVIPKSAATVARVLQENGYATAMFGKANLTPEWETGPAGPFERWPTGLGFDHFYGFLVAETDQYTPALYENTTPVEAPREPGYILDKDLADHAIQWLREQHATASDRPFFMYYATGSTHTPHQAPPEWIAKFKGRFDQGWDQLREEILQRQIEMGIVPRGTPLAAPPPGMPKWADLSPEDRKLYAHQMEVYAGMLAFADHQIGRVLAEAKALGEEDNTLVIFMEGDNGASGEGEMTGVMNHQDSYNGLKEDQAEARRRMGELGSPTMSGHYAAGWAMAMDTPFPWMKQYASHLGGTRDGMVISWPERIKQTGQIRSQYTHVTDVLPTILAAAKITPPQVVDGAQQQPIDGTDMSYSFDAPKAASTHGVQYYNIMGNAGIYKDGWLASTTPISIPWQALTVASKTPFTERKWELYNLDNDFSQAHDVAAQHSDKLAELKVLYYREAKRNNVVPGLATSAFYRWETDHGRANTVTYNGPVSRIPWAIAPDVLNRSFSIKAKVSVPVGGAQGTLVTQGGRFGGYCFCVINGAPTFIYNAGAAGTTQISANKPLSPGDHEVEASFHYDGSGRGQGGDLSLKVDGQVIGTGRIARTTPILFGIDEAFDIGRDTGSAVSDAYQAPFAFTGGVGNVSVELGEQYAATAARSATPK